MQTPITASMLYDLVACPHRVTMDLHGDPKKRGKPNAFVQLLWEKGSLFEQEVINNLEIPYLDLSQYAGSEKEQHTLEAMGRGEPLIYGARIEEGGLLGDPDLLRKEGTGYVAVDIKSGAGQEGVEDLSRPKKHYAVQLGLYTDILERKGLSAGRYAFIWDVHGNEVSYNFTAPYGKRNPRTLWQDYEDCLNTAMAIVDDKGLTQPAYFGTCKLCHWYSACLDRLEKQDDLTLIPELGRAKRDSMRDRVPTIHRLAESDPETFVTGKKTVFPGIGPPTLLKFHSRAVLITTEGATPILIENVDLPDHEIELFFDIEVDPMRDVCYLHGIVERRGGSTATEKFKSFFAETPTSEAERAAFSDAFQYLKKNQPCSIYYYSKYERTMYRKLQQKYSDICSETDIEELFDPKHAVDLYNDVVRKSIEWPTRDHSIKTLAQYLGFNWRDKEPSGAASIEWFDRWIKTGDRQIRQRILDYNEDDCIATRVLLDGIRSLSKS